MKKLQQNTPKKKVVKYGFITKMVLQKGKPKEEFSLLKENSTACQPGKQDSKTLSPQLQEKILTVFGLSYLIPFQKYMYPMIMTNQENQLQSSWRIELEQKNLLRYYIQKESRTQMITSKLTML